MANVVGQLFQVLDERGNIDSAMVLGLDAMRRFERLGMMNEVASVIGPG